MSSITPTIGRKVWFWATEPENHSIEDHDQALDATVIFVHPDKTVNLQVVDHQGDITTQFGVELRDPQEGDRHFSDTLNEGVATWMPYQVGQAKKG